jgi:hypothetical protein
VDHYRQFNDIARTVAADTNIALIDLDALVPHSRSYMIDAVHLNDDGSKLVATLVAKELARFFPEYTLAAAQ